MAIHTWTGNNNMIGRPPMAIHDGEEELDDLLDIDEDANDAWIAEIWPDEGVSSDAQYFDRLGIEEEVVPATHSVPVGEPDVAPLHGEITLSDTVVNNLISVNDIATVSVIDELKDEIRELESKVDNQQMVMDTQTTDIRILSERLDFLMEQSQRTERLIERYNQQYTISLNTGLI